tara:strand:- start:19832 stop:20164 length:333 start_codon:yes stop_codon:yes gene_type:complete
MSKIELSNKTERKIKFLWGDFWGCEYEIDGEEYYTDEYQFSEDFRPDDYYIDGETGFVLLTVSFTDEEIGLKFEVIVSFERKEENGEINWYEMLDEDGNSSVAAATITEL